MIDLDKLADFRSDSEVFIAEGKAIVQKLDKLIALLPVFFDRAKVHFANAPFPNGKDRNRMTAIAQHIGFNIGDIEKKLVPARDLASSIHTAAEGACVVVDRLTGELYD